MPEWLENRRLLDVPGQKDVAVNLSKIPANGGAKRKDISIRCFQPVSVQEPS